jgi:DNA-binding CsgD family transcriptional regulator
MSLGVRSSSYEAPLVGRERELGEFESLVESDVRFLYVHGETGIGKSSYLAACMRVCDARGIRWAQVTVSGDDGDLGRVTSSLVDLGLADDHNSGKPSRAVLFLDHVDPIEPLEEMLCGQLVPEVPRNMLIVLASRRRPSIRFALLPGWGVEFRDVSLAPLSEDAERELLERRGVQPDDCSALISCTGGVPLMTLVVGTTAMHAARFELEEAESCLRSTLRLSEVPAHSLQATWALDVCALARGVTGELLQEVPGLREQADGLFSWLSTCSFVEETPSGIQVHRVVRRALLQDLKRHRPERRVLLHAQLRRYYLRQLESGADTERWLVDLFFLDRDLAYMSGAGPWSEVERSAWRVRSATEEALTPVARRMAEGRRADDAERVTRFQGTVGVRATVLAADSGEPQGLVFGLPLARIPEPPLHDAALEAALSFASALDAVEGSVFVTLWNRQDSSFDVWVSSVARVFHELMARARLDLVLVNASDMARFEGLARSMGLHTSVVPIPCRSEGSSLVALDLRGRSLMECLREWASRSTLEPRARGLASAPPSGASAGDGTRSTAAGEEGRGQSDLGELLRAKARRLAEEAELTQREREVFDLMLLGRNAREIGTVLGITARTAKFHQSNLLQKLGADGRTDLLRLLM